MICVSHERFCLNPCSRLQSMLFFSRCFIILLLKICSKNLQDMQVSDIGLYFVGLCLSPLLYTGATFAWFQSDGTFPDVKDLVKILSSIFCTYV